MWCEIFIQCEIQCEIQLDVVLKILYTIICCDDYADMAELADALDLGSSGRPWGFESLYPH